jgi:teichuronic acid biosynthesis glycosyltransferase TuaC
MRVLAVTNIFPTEADPSQGTFVEQQIKGLRKAGVEIEVLHFDRRGQGMSAYKDISAAVRQAEARFRPDLVHAMYGGVLGHRTVSAASRPTVISFCGSDLLGDADNSWVRRRIIGRYRVWVSHRAARAASAIVVKSAGLCEALPPDIDAAKVTILPNGIDLNRFRPLDRDRCRASLRLDSKKFNILFVDSKGQHRKRLWLAEAAAEAARELGVPAQLHAIGNVAHDQVPVWLNGADALILTSIHEGSPNIVKEALACDVPVVSVNVGDVEERIAGVDGCYLCGDAPRDLGAALQAVYSGRRRVEGRERMRELSIEAVAERMIQVYRGVVPATLAAGAAN